MSKEDLIELIYSICEDCQGRPDGFNCPVQGLLDEDS